MAVVSLPLCNNYPCPPCPIISDIMQQNCGCGNGAISLKKQTIWLNQAGGSSQRMWRWGRWQQSWCCYHIFHVRGDEAAGATEIIIMQNCVVLCRVGMGCAVKSGLSVPLEYKYHPKLGLRISWKLSVSSINRWGTRGCQTFFHSHYHYENVFTFPLYIGLLVSEPYLRDDVNTSSQKWGKVVMIEKKPDDPHQESMMSSLPFQFEFN